MTISTSQAKLADAMTNANQPRGSESAVLGYVGTGLIAFGAVALGSRRRFFQGALED